MFHHTYMYIYVSVYITLFREKFKDKSNKTQIIYLFTNINLITFEEILIASNTFMLTFFQSSRQCWDSIFEMVFSSCSKFSFTVSTDLKRRFCSGSFNLKNWKKSYHAWSGEYSACEIMLICFGQNFTNKLRNVNQHVLRKCLIS